MTDDNTQAADAWKSHEENPERSLPEPDDDAEAEALTRHEGEVNTTTRGASVSDLTSKL